MMSGKEQVPPGQELTDSAEDVLDQLHRIDLERVVGKFHSRAELVAAMCECAAAVARSLGVLDRSVATDQYPLLTAATLTFGAEHAGVHVNPGRARARFELFLSHRGLPPEVAVLITEADSATTVRMLTTAYRVERELTRSRPRGEPPFVHGLVAAAAAAAMPDRTDAAALAGAVLDRGAELAAHYQASDRKRPGMTLSVPGNARFLVDMAGYEQAMAEVTAPAEDPLAKMEQALGPMEWRLRQAMSEASRDLGLGGVDEQDCIVFFPALAELIGGADARRIFSRVNRSVNRALLRYDRKAVATAPDDLPRSGGEPSGAEHPDLDDLTGWTLAVLFATAPGALRTTLSSWLLGRRPPDTQEDLDELLERTRRAEWVVLAVPPCPPPEPERLSVAERSAVFGSLRARFVEAEHRVDGGPVALLAAALPALWTRRRGVVNTFAATIMADGGPSSTVQNATLVAAVVARGPGQVVQAIAGAAHDPATTCGTTDDLRPRCSSRLGTAAPQPDEICPARPWGEPGVVDCYRTLADLVFLDTHHAARRRLERYERDKGMWFDRIRFGAGRPDADSPQA